MPYERFEIDRQHGLKHVHASTVSLHQLDANQNSADPVELLNVLARKVAAAQSHDHGQLEAAARDIFATAQRLVEKVAGQA